MVVGGGKGRNGMKGKGLRKATTENNLLHLFFATHFKPSRPLNRGQWSVALDDRKRQEV